MEILEGIKTRQSIRAFKPKSIAKGVLKKDVAGGEQQSLLYQHSTLGGGCGKG